MIDKIKLVFALLLVAAGVAGFYLLADHAMVIRILAVLAGLIAAVVLMSTTPLGKEFFAFAREAVVETRKVVWPSRKETIQTTVAVFVLVLVMAIFLWVVDVGFLWMVKMLMGRSA
ncbi:MAG: preprotein translocase subunit SecE [Candidatus Methylopumilus sp.]|jgi:preprotein translocase subunit SecE